MNNKQYDIPDQPEPNRVYFMPPMMSPKQKQNILLFIIFSAIAVVGGLIMISAYLGVW